nr:PREDICTED: epithelial chloride channel protein-like [Latimeria chalumnae]|eukprot:XP_014339987.1 PREDICTED: epithelial chloride channel protein-like [Latimeria chalumnae]
MFCYLKNNAVCDPCEFNKRTGLPTGQCDFIPSKKQNTAASIMFQQFLSPVINFCDETNHNLEALNDQNKVCNHKSTWEVISQTQDFKNRNPPTSVNPPTPTFTLLQAEERVVCLVLDTSGSMSGVRLLIQVTQQSLNHVLC